MIGADIKAGNIVAAVEREIRRGLEAKGFTVVSPDDPTERELELRLRAFKFFIETGFFTGGENTSVVINAEARNGRDDLDRTYRTNRENRALFVPTGGEIDEKLNASLENVLNQIMSDMKLMEFLAR